MACILFGKGYAEDKVAAQKAPDEEHRQQEPLDLVHLYVVLQLLYVAYVQLRHDEPCQHDDGYDAGHDQVHRDIALDGAVQAEQYADGHHGKEWYEE